MNEIFSFRKELNMKKIIIIVLIILIILGVILWNWETGLSKEPSEAVTA